MAGFADTLRGDGLAKAHRALAGLQGDPVQLNRARMRFNDSPPLYTSDRSGTTTRSESPNPPSEEQRCRQRQRTQIGLGRAASTPYEQFGDQRTEEEKRLWEAHRNRTCRLPANVEPKKLAYEIVKNRWVEQGIWSNKWSTFASGRWKHEEPLKFKSESETDSEALTRLFSLSQPKPRQPKSDEEKRRITEQRAVQEREREASRPYFQFIFQISKERERIVDESRSEEGAIAANINSRAYKSVKATWIKRGIWNKKWDILPGMSWKHEEPLEETANSPISAAASRSRNAQLPGGHERVEASPRRIFGFLSPVEPSQPQESSIASALQQRPGQTLRRSNRKYSQKAQVMVNESLRPVHPLKLSKASQKTQLRPQRQPNVSKKVSFSGLPLSSHGGTLEPQPLVVQALPRRSQRIQPPVPSIATASTDPSKPLTWSKPEQNVAKNVTPKSSAKPQGISKRQPAKATLGKAREKMNQ